MSSQRRYFLISSVGGTMAGGATFAVRKTLGINFDFHYTASGSAPVDLHHAANSRGIAHSLAPTLVHNNLPVFLRPWDRKFFNTRPFAEHVVSALDGISSTSELPGLKIAVALADAEFTTPVKNGKSVHYAIIDSECNMSLVTALAATCACPPTRPVLIENQKVKLIVDDGKEGKRYELVTVKCGKLLDPGMLEKMPLTPAFIDAREGDVLFVVNLGITNVKEKKVIELFEQILEYEHFDKLARIFAPFSLLRSIFINEVNKHRFDFEKYRQLARERGIVLIEVTVNSSCVEKKSLLDQKVLLNSLIAIVAGIKAWDELQKASSRKGLFNFTVLLASTVAITAAIKACLAIEKIIYSNTPLNKRSIFDSRNIPYAVTAGISAAIRGLGEYQEIMEQPGQLGDLSDRGSN